MKKILMLFFSILLLSCSNIPDSSSSSRVNKWEFRLDGVLYKGSESLFFDGYNSYKTSRGVLCLGKSRLTVLIAFPKSSTGNFIINGSSGINNFEIIFDHTTSVFSPDVDTYECTANHTMNVNVSTLSVNSDVRNPGIAIGTFSGTIKNPDGNSSIVTDGKFEVRAEEY